jgi:hypothetical protein
MRLLIGIDDTDNLESRGTGHRARQLGMLLQERGLANLKGITRHQLLVSPQIPYTSHNSSACLVFEAVQENLASIQQTSREFLLADSASGSDAGLCIAWWEQANPILQNFGARAKVEVLTQAEAYQVAQAEGVFLESLTGTGGGVIGALAGIGLRAGGNDGRFLWLSGIRELNGLFTLDDVLSKTGVEELCTLGGEVIPLASVIRLGEWTRPVLRNHKAVLFMEEVFDNGQSEWRVIAKETIKQLSQ